MTTTTEFSAVDLDKKLRAMGIKEATRKGVNMLQIANDRAASRVYELLGPGDEVAAVGEDYEKGIESWVCVLSHTDDRKLLYWIPVLCPLCAGRLGWLPAFDAELGNRHEVICPGAGRWEHTDDNPEAMRVNFRPHVARRAKMILSHWVNGGRK